MFILATVLAVLALVFFAGPRVPVNTRFDIPELPDDLDTWLKQRESRFTDLTAGAEKCISWAHEDKRRTPYAFVYLHGFSACRQESEPVPSDVAKAFGSNIYYARLAGNGRSDDALAEGSVHKWVNDASEALSIANRIGERTVIIGCSTGATIGWWIARQAPFQQQIAAMVFFSPNFGVFDKNARFLLWPWGAQIARLAVGEYRSSKPVTEQQAKYWTNRYPIKALLPMMAMVQLARKYAPSSNRLPVYVLYSNFDTTVDATLIKQFYNGLDSAKTSLLIDDPNAASRHVLVGDIMAPQNNAAVTHSVIEFLQKHLAAEAD
jgi:esterase/lipase